jgi:hypothetical protein
VGAGPPAILLELAAKFGLAGTCRGLLFSNGLAQAYLLSPAASAGKPRGIRSNCGSPQGELRQLSRTLASSSLSLSVSHLTLASLSRRRPQAEGRPGGQAAAAPAGPQPPGRQCPPHPVLQPAPRRTGTVFSSDPPRKAAASTRRPPRGGLHATVPSPRGGE